MVATVKQKKTNKTKKATLWQKHTVSFGLAAVT